jgi:dTDP-4-amino-4,6-dideoxy-D-galactose acyltransferase
MLTWDSDFFQMRIARLDGCKLGASEIGEIDTWCRNEKVDCLYFLADANCSETSTNAELGNFEFKDTRMTYEWKSSLGARGIDPRIGTNVSFRRFTESDLDSLVRIARTAHNDSRFYFDQRFSASDCSKLYEAWIRKACVEDYVIVGTLDSIPSGYVTCKITGANSASIGLAAVDREKHGVGIGRAMMDAALAWFSNEGLTNVSVVTQGRNVAAHRFYQSAGFLTRKTENWYHKWYSQNLHNT